MSIVLSISFVLHPKKAVLRQIQPAMTQNRMYICRVGSNTLFPTWDLFYTSGYPNKVPSYPTALRMAKAPLGFGHFECIRVGFSLLPDFMDAQENFVPVTSLISFCFASNFMVFCDYFTNFEPQLKISEITTKDHRWGTKPEYLGKLFASRKTWLVSHRSSDA